MHHGDIQYLQFDKEWNLNSLNKKFISTIVELDENEDYRLKETDSDWNLGKCMSMYVCIYVCMYAVAVRSEVFVLQALNGMFVLYVL